MSANFTIEELCRSATADAHGIDNTPDEDQLSNMEKFLIPGAEEVRALLGNRPILISSGLRVSALNAVIPGSSDTSAHTKGYAMDFTCPSYGSPWQICQAIAQSDIDFDQLIYESVKNRYGDVVIWVHISFDPRNRKQLLTKLPAQPYRVGLHLA